MRSVRFVAPVLCMYGNSSYFRKGFCSHDIVSPKNGAMIGYVTDIEGNLNYWQRFKKTSKVLDASGENIKLKDNCYLVFGGDVCDRGVGDIAVATEMTKLKKTYPDR
jgi:hypothetical protein